MNATRNSPRNFPRAAVLLSLLISAAAYGCSSESARSHDSEGAIEVDSEVGCDECEISVTPVARLGRSSDPSSVRPDALASPCVVATAGDGFVLSAVVGGGELFRYTADGALIERVGRSGEGPGEFGQNLRVLRGEGELHVIDNSNIRRVVLDNDGALLSTHRLPGRALSVGLLRSGALIMHARGMEGQEGDRALFAEISPDGSRTTFLGDRPTSVEERDTEQWLVSPSPRGGFWTANGWRYRLEYWDTTRTVSNVVERAAEWFPPDQTFQDDMYRVSPPPAWLSHVYEDDELRLWTYSMVPDVDWEPGPAERPNPTWMERTFDMVIEVIDLRDGQLLATTRYPTVLAPVCGTDLMYSVEYTDAGDTRTLVVRPALTPE